MLEMWMGASFLMIPPLVFCAEGLVCLVMMFTPSTNTLASSGNTSRTFRAFLGSLSSPVITTTLSPFLILNLGLNLLLILFDFTRLRRKLAKVLQHFRRQ